MLLEVLPAVFVRYCNCCLPSEVEYRISATFFAPASRDSRIINPILSALLPLNVSLPRRPTKVKSPLTLWYAKWNASAEPLMSVPDPETRKVVLLIAEHDALPTVETV